ALSYEVQEQCRERLRARLDNLYGPTEASIDVTYWECAEDEQRRVPIGRPISNTEIYVLDSSLEAVGIGVTGELYIGGEGLGRGYRGRAELTAEKFIANPHSGRSGSRLYRTGDVGRRRVGGEIEYLGRIDHQVKVRGLRIELGEIEAALREHPLIREAVVEASREGVHSTRLIGYVVPEAGRRVSGKELREYLKEKLPEYMAPSLFVELEALPLSPNGKLDRRALPKPEIRQKETSELPRTVVEEVLAGIWAEVLGREQVGVEENFFELGGHSLLATQMVSRVRQAFRAEVSLRWVFESPTVASLSKRIEEGMGSGGEQIAPPMTPVQRNQAMPLSFAQERLWFIDQME